MDKTPTTAGFADFEFDLITGELRRQSARIHLQHQPSLVLSVLLSKPGRLVTRDELCRAIWQGRTVEFDAGLNFSVRQVRRALGDNAESPVFVETIPRKGYRFIADVTFSSGKTNRSLPRLSSWRTGLGLLAVLAVLAAMGVAFSRRSQVASDGSRPLKIAVLPLQVLNERNGLEPFAQGLTEDLITGLVGLGSERLRVIAYSSMRQVGEQRSDLATLRSRLGADYVVRGTLRDAGGQRRITIRLEDVRDGSLTWAGRFDGRASEGMTADADRIAVNIARSLSVGGLDGRPASRMGTLPVAIQESLLRARWFLNRQTQEDSERALDELDFIRTTLENDARVWALTAETRNSLGRHGEAEAAAREAIRLDAGLAEGPYHLGQALVAGRRFEEALEAFEHAVELSPGMARYHQALAYQLWRQKRHTEAVQHLEVARELDPLSVDLEVDLGYLYIDVDRHQEAIEHCERGLVLLPESRWGRLCLLRAHYLLGDLAAALAQAQEVLRLEGAAPDILAALDRADARTGMLTLFAQVLPDSGERAGAGTSSDLAREIRSLLARTHSALQDRARVAEGSAPDRPHRGPGPERPAYERWLTYAWGDPRLERLFAREDWPIPWAGAPSN